MPADQPKRPRLLDLFCCAGGAARGYQQAGFDVWGVDIEHQPRYVGDHFIRGDAIQVAAQFILNNGYYRFDAIHASPPCQAHSDLQKQSKRTYEDFIPEVRTLLDASHLPYVIENVEGAPLIDPVTLCGTQFPGLRVIRHRLFETNWPLTPPPIHPKHPLVFTHDKRKAHYGRLDQDTSFVQVTGGGNCSIANARDALGIDWMNKHELNEALPPAYTEFIGRQLLAHLGQSKPCPRHGQVDCAFRGPCGDLAFLAPVTRLVAESNHRPVAAAGIQATR